MSGAGGVTPMVFQNDSGDQSATTKSAVSAGAINITKPNEQTQDLANLNRDATNLNGTVAKTPDIQKTLSQQADTMNAAQAAGQTISQGIGLYADGKRKDAIDAAKAAYERGDLVAMQSYIDQAQSWDEGGASRAGLQATGGALIGGLGGGSALTAIGGAAGAGASSLLANQAEKISKSVGDTTGSPLVGNIAANVAATVGGALVGGSAGAAAASNVELYNANEDRNRREDQKEIAELQDQLHKEQAMLGQRSTIQKNDGGSAVVPGSLNSAVGAAGGGKAAGKSPIGASTTTSGTTPMIGGVTVVDRRTGAVYQGTVDLQPTLDRIANGGAPISRNDGTTFENRPVKGAQLLPVKPDGYYKEYVVPTQGVNGPGPQRIITGKGGEIYYTPDHYDSFVPIKPSKPQ